MDKLLYVNYANYFAASTSCNIYYLSSAVTCAKFESSFLANYSNYPAVTYKLEIASGIFVNSSCSVATGPHMDTSFSYLSI